MQFSYDKDVDAFSIRFHEGKYAESDEIKDGVVFDYDKQGKILGIEILNASKNFSEPFAEAIAKHRFQKNVAIDPAG